MKKIIASLILLTLMAVPAMALAQPSVTISSIEGLVEAIKRPLWVIFGLIALIAFVISGILFLSAAGNPEKIAQARTAFLWGVVGVVVGIIAFSIVAIVESAL